ncbi:hypothetical protein [Nocardia terpenica]|uniref:hypothetical protein n=1 Tax=Nocardia terpenica TaxID=455432 RepID=UPI0012FE4FCA|nr:hypothetical protein [Nocardia terpenica]
MDIVLEGFQFDENFFEDYSTSVRQRYHDRYAKFFKDLPYNNSGALWAYPLALTRVPGSLERAILIGTLTECYFSIDDSSTEYRKTILSEMWRYKYSQTPEHSLIRHIVGDSSIFLRETHELFVDYTIEWLCLDHILKERHDWPPEVQVILRGCDAGIHGWFMLFVDSFTGYSWRQVVDNDPALDFSFCFDWIIIAAYWNDEFSDSHRRPDAAISLTSPHLIDNEIITAAFANSICLLEANAANHELILLLLRCALVLYCRHNSRYLARGKEVSQKLLSFDR